MFYTAFTIGLFGSLHCIGMCGPIALAIPMHQHSRWQLVQNSLLYNFGKATTYTILGFLVGIIGEGLVFAGLQKWLSILTGIFILVVVLYAVNLEQKFVALPYFNRLFFHLKSSLGHVLKSTSQLAIFSTGLLNGLLPCGLVYLALASAVSLGGFWESGLFMFAFGIGTMPLMLLLIFTGNTTYLKSRLALQKLYPAFLVVLAFWFIYRGVYFYLPPDFQLSAALELMPMCH